MATSSVYCTNRDLKDVYPNIDEFDSKTPIYGWNVASGSQYVAYNVGLVTALFVAGNNQGTARTSVNDVNNNGEWYYDSTDDAVYYYNDTTSPNDLLMESGEDYATLKTRYIANASRYIDSRLDGELPRDAFKDKEGNYDYVIVRLTALYACSFLIKSMEATSEVANEFTKEAEFLISQLNDGKTKLSFQISGDASQGNLREVTAPQADNALRIVDVQGVYTGSGYDLMKIYIDTGDGGALGVGKFSVQNKDSVKLKNNLLVDSEIITGDYQHLGNGLKIRFSGKNDSSIATEGDEYELEVFGWSEPTDNPTVRGIKMSRSYPFSNSIIKRRL